MGKLYDRLIRDFRIEEGLKACINCGTCTAICPAASFYQYDPRQIVDSVQSQDEQEILHLLKSDVIWYCGECMSCKTRCPRGNTPGLIIIALRSLSQEMGYFTESEKGRQQLAIKRTVGDWILKYGYCLYMPEIGIEMHPEQGPVWDWLKKNHKDVFALLGANIGGEGPGILRKIPDDTLKEIEKIFEVTGGLQRYEQIEKCSGMKAESMDLDLDEGIENPYFVNIYTANNNQHTRE